MQVIDVWGKIYTDHWNGRVLPHVIERDDGRVETFESAANYFRGPRTGIEEDLLSQLNGPILDLGAGPGSYSLFLQDRGLEMTTADYSPGALEVCRARGCRRVIRMDLRSIELEPEGFSSVIVMGNTLGLHQTPETFGGLLASLRQAVPRAGRILFSMIDPLDAPDENHLRYHEHNRAQGLPPGLARIRLKYDGLVDEWAHLWMLTEGELESQLNGSGWRQLESQASGKFRIRMLEAEA